MSQDKPIVNDLIYQRVSYSEALSHADWLCQKQYAVRYSDARGNWKSLVLRQPSDLAELQVPSGQVFIPTPPAAGILPVKMARDNYDYEEPFFRSLTEFKAMSPKQRFDHLKATAEQLTKLRTDNLKPEQQVRAIVDAAQSAFMVNKTLFMEEVITPDRLQVYVGVKAETSNIVRRVTDHIGGHAPAHFLIDLLKYLSSGSTIGHVNRVFTQCVGLFFFYNEFLAKKGWIGLVRRNFAKEYGSHYARLLPEAEILTLDRVFPRVGPISDLDLQDYALGTLLHDIGKVPQIDYFESSAGYDREKVVQHAFSGYNILRKTYDKSRAVSHMAGDHHEYYGHPHGYGILRVQYDPPAKENGTKTMHCLSLDLPMVEDRSALAFMPAKLLEVVDVYDALTDPERKYRARTTYSPKEAVELMRTDFVDAELKLDPMLFDLFVLFLEAEGVLTGARQNLIYQGLAAV